MRTLASTFGTRDEAEAASRRLQSIGIPGDRIVLKDVAPAGDAAPGASSAAGAAFISVKVTSEQVEAVSEILKSNGSAAAAPAAAPVVGTPASEQPIETVRSAPVFDGTAETVRPARAEPEQPARAALRPGSEFGTGAPPVAREPAPAAQPAAAKPRASARERGRLGRYLIYYGLALVAAFVIGAWLGMLS